MNHAFEMSGVQRGARIRRTPFFQSTQDAGARGYTVYNHMLFPICFDDLEREYWKLVNEVTIWDVAVERQVEITGKDAFAFTNRLVTRNLGKCQVGQGKYVVITDENGGIVNDPVLLRLGENHFWLAAADSDLLLWAKGVALGSGMEVEIREPDVSPLQIQGPKSKEIIRALFGDGALELEYYRFLETELDGIPVVLTRTGWSAEVGYEIYLRDGSRGKDLWDRIMEAGRPHGITPTGPSDIRRVEAGILNYGADMTIENNPYEVGLDWQVHLKTGGDFIGKEALARLRSNGIRRKLVGIEIEGDRIDFNMTKWPARVNGTDVGHVTSAVYSPRLEKNIGYAMVPIAHAEIGQRLSISVDNRDERSAVVVPRPFIDPTKEIPKS